MSAMTDSLPDRMREKPDVSVVVPVYNAEPTLPELIERLHSVLAVCSRRFEIVLVNDGSSDESWRVIRELTQKRTWVRGISLARNYGQHNALLCGIRAARYETMVTLDDDLQNPPEEIPKLLEQLAKGYDVVYGVPQQAQHGLMRGLASQITKLVLRNAMGAEIARNVSAFRALRKRVCMAFRHFQGSFVCLDVLLTWGTTRFAAVRVRQEPRVTGVSGYSVGRLITHASNMITGFSVLPLQVANIVGFAFTFFGFFILMYVVGRYFLKGSPVPGFQFLASMIAIFSGAQLFALGVIGEYLARMHFRTMERPTYALHDTTFSQETTTSGLPTNASPSTISDEN